MSEFIDEVIKPLGHFLTRDVIYILGGSLVVLAFLHVCDRFPTDSTPNIYLAMILIFGHPLGYLVLEVACWTGLLTTSLDSFVGDSPRRFWKWIGKHLYRASTHREWQQADAMITERLLDFEARHSNPELSHSYSRYQRTITLKTINAVIGSCSVSASALVFAHFLWRPKGTKFDLVIGTALLVTGALHVANAWVKGALQVDQIRQFYQKTSAPVPSAPAKQHAEQESR